MAENAQLKESGDAPVAIITGSATGVGAEVARALASRGYRIVVNYSRNAQAAQETAKACLDLGAEVAVVKADVADDADCRALVAAAVTRWGRVDVLVNNAAVTASADFFDLETMDPADFERILKVNVVGAFQASRAAMPHLREVGGAIVNVSSNVALTGGGTSIAYNASKGALNSMTLALARVAAPQVRVNAVLPGVIDTDWMTKVLGAEAFRGVSAASANATPLGRIAGPRDVAEVIVWLATQATFLTGGLLPVDGGVRLMSRAQQPQASS